MSRFDPPAYIERMVIFLTLDGSILLQVGNQRLKCTTEELEAIIHAHMLHHVVLVEILRGENGNNHKIVVVTE